MCIRFYYLGQDGGVGVACGGVRCCHVGVRVGSGGLGVVLASGL